MRHDVMQLWLVRWQNTRRSTAWLICVATLDRAQRTMSLWPWWWWRRCRCAGVWADRAPRDGRLDNTKAIYIHVCAGPTALGVQVKILQVDFTGVSFSARDTARRLDCAADSAKGDVSCVDVVRRVTLWLSKTAQSQIRAANSHGAQNTEISRWQAQMCTQIRRGASYSPRSYLQFLR